MSLHNQPNKEKSTIVIVGGGAGGLSLLNNLSTTIDPDKQRVILIDARPTMIHLPSTLRLIVSNADDLLKRSIHPYGDHTFRNKLTGTGIFIHASVKEIDFGKPGDGGILTLDNGETVAYDVLVLATGSTWPRPIAFPTENMKEITEHIQAMRAEFDTAQDILLVGGGSVGIGSYSQCRFHTFGLIIRQNFPVNCETFSQFVILSSTVSLKCPHFFFSVEAHHDHSP